jgi:positive regulator of sigma E activity
VFVVLCAADLFAGTNVIPLREAGRPAKAAVLLMFTPLLAFLAMVSLRQLPFAEVRLVVWVRAALCAALFLIINF